MTNKKFFISKISVICAISLLFFSSCENKDDAPKGKFENGAFIINEGTFQANNGSISFYNYGTDSVSNNIFQTVNGRVLGDVVQSIKMYGDNAFIAVNNSNKVEVVDPYTFEEKGVVEGLMLPRYIEANGSKAYISCWDSTVKVMDVTSLEVKKSIEVGTGPERMLIANGNLYVANGGAYGTDSTISVVSLESESVIASIDVKYNPKSMVVDNLGKIWVLCAGKALYDGWTLIEESPSILYKIDPATNKVVLSVELFENSHPSILQIDKNGSTLYLNGGYVASGIYSLVVADDKATMTKIIDKSAYGFSYDKKSNTLFVCDAGDYTSAGTLFRYSTSGEKLGEYKVGVVPNGAGFKNTEQ